MRRNSAPQSYFSTRITPPVLLTRKPCDDRASITAASNFSVTFHMDADFHTRDRVVKRPCRWLGQVLRNGILGMWESGPVGVKGHMSSSRAPLLAPSPLRTGLEGFPSSGSSTPKRPLEKRGRGLIQKPNKTCSILACCRFGRRGRIHQACVKPHQRLAPSSFALLHSSVPQAVSSWSTNGKSAPFLAR